MPPEMPPFQPFRADPSADPKENALGFLTWLSEGVFRIHALSEATYKYSRATYEAQARAIGVRPRVGVAGPSQVRGAAPFPVDQALFNFGRFAIQNRKAIGEFLKGIFR